MAACRRGYSGVFRGIPVQPGVFLEKGAFDFGLWGNWVLASSEIVSIKASVRSLVAFSIQEETAWSFSSYRQAQEGTLAHGLLQKRHTEEGCYEAEVWLSDSFEAPGCIVEISGRADGIWTYPDKTIIHEIKTTSAPLTGISEDYSEAHWAQARLYAYLWAKAHSLDSMSVRLTYYRRETGEEKSFDRAYPLDKLERFFKNLLYPYAAWSVAQAKWRALRNLTIKNMAFPFSGYRKGQKLLAYNTWKSIEEGKRLFAQAPTGTGKTMGVLYPAIKALGEGKLDRIFYLTAKTTTRAIAENAYKMLEKDGLRLKVLTLTAKDKLCLLPIKNCNPEKCEFIQGFMSRSKRVVQGLLKKHDFFSRESIIEAAEKHRLCPFELSLELALGCDLIICDYNYAFDPRVYLKRFFQQKGRENYAFLVDEAHNLFDRAREMYSASLSMKSITLLAKSLRKEEPVIYKTLRALKKTIASLEPLFQSSLSQAAGRDYYSSPEPPGLLTECLDAFLERTEAWIMAQEEAETHPYGEDLITLFFDLLHFKNILELFSPRYRTLATGTKGRLVITLLCLDPGEMLDKRMDMAQTAVLFSATLSPLGYFKNILGGRKGDITLRLPSPFPRENLFVVNQDLIETRYRQRERHMEGLAQAIKGWVEGRGGNTMVFFPSYKYMLEVHQLLSLMPLEWELHLQEREMDDEARARFLALFDETGAIPRIGLCVMGGAFGEGIDLTGDRLTSVIVVGVGLPQVCPEQEILRAYYEKERGTGFDYAYTFPGLNKVLQAAGRLIRTETDQGALLLIDSRYAERDYLALLPEEWHPIPRVARGLSLVESVQGFWAEKNIKEKGGALYGAQNRND